ncbi:hypothetical protein Prum_069250 [Phytohabitans rumicis]|uniref:Uncharacterized protein n=2 Tax=Phytohabitans rumicis TaxID=1076125 RepID=A0A6V8L7Q1_9ACTN|nr:hypothetical protein Prum_069250 [Phytohabitans rumicis]
MVTFLTACGLDEESRTPWLAAWERVATAHLRRPAGAVRIREARARLLGVHDSIQADAATRELPVYVPRDLDPDLRTAITAAAEMGGFVLLVGGSSVGKSRALYEAVQAALPEWWLIHPEDVAAIRAFAACPSPRTVVWLDELQRLLSLENRLTAGLARELIRAGAVLVATLWPHEYHERSATRIPGMPDLNAGDRELLDIADLIDVPDRFSASERRRAEALSGIDSRIRVALDSEDGGFTQVLAAGPDLVRRWEHAHDPYGKAVLTAALDARRVGVQTPLTRTLLVAAAAAYLMPADQAAAPPDWAHQALSYATAKLRGATAALTPVSNEIGRPTGYVVADFLYQHARQVRREVPLPELAWQALVEHHQDRDFDELVAGAARRGRSGHLEALYRRGAETGNRDAARQLVDLLVTQGRADEASAVLIRHDDQVGDWITALSVGDPLLQQGRVDEAIRVLGPYLLGNYRDSGITWGTREVIDRFVKYGYADEAAALLRPHADAGNRDASISLARVLGASGRVEELRLRADAGDQTAALSLVDLLVRMGDTDGLRQRADMGDLHAAGKLASLFVEQHKLGDAIAVLRQAADAGEGDASRRLAVLLLKEGNLEELRERASAGDQPATRRLADRLRAERRFEEAIDVLRPAANSGDRLAADQLVDLYMARGEVEDAIGVLRQHADAGYGDAAVRLVALLARDGRLDDLQAEVNAGTFGAAEQLAAITRSSTRDNDDAAGRLKL